MILVTGATGHLGKLTLEFLLQGQRWGVQTLEIQSSWRTS